MLPETFSQKFLVVLVIHVFACEILVCFLEHFITLPNTQLNELLPNNKNPDISFQ